MPIKIISAVCFTLIVRAVVGCGLQDGSDGSKPGGNAPPDCQGVACSDVGGADSAPSADAGAVGTGTDAVVVPPTTIEEPAPIKFKACDMTFAIKYANGSPCGEVRGTLPDMTWSSGQFVIDCDNDGRLDLSYPAIIPGSYELSYLDRECPNEVPRANWAAYGAPETLRGMTATARSFLFCNWYDARTGKVLTVTDPGCDIRFTVQNGCIMMPDGNMKDFK